VAFTKGAESTNQKKELEEEKTCPHQYNVYRRVSLDHSLIHSKIDKKGESDLSRECSPASVVQC
jgi:hypothetical protein